MFERFRRSNIAPIVEAQSPEVIFEDTRKAYIQAEKRVNEDIRTGILSTDALINLVDRYSDWVDVRVKAALTPLSQQPKI